MHPNGQLPAYEWNFADVNPPVHAWAALRVYEIDKRRTGKGDRGEARYFAAIAVFQYSSARDDIHSNNERSSPLPELTRPPIALLTSRLPYFPASAPASITERSEVGRDPNQACTTGTVRSSPWSPSRLRASTRSCLKLRNPSLPFPPDRRVADY